MSIQYTVLGFEPTTFGTRVSSHNHQTRPPALWSGVCGTVGRATAPVVQIQSLAFYFLSVSTVLKRRKSKGTIICKKITLFCNLYIVIPSIKTKMVSP